MPLAAFSKRDPISNEVAIKYFLFGALFIRNTSGGNRSRIWNYREVLTSVLPLWHLLPCRRIWYQLDSLRSHSLWRDLVSKWALFPFTCGSLMLMKVHPQQLERYWLPGYKESWLCSCHSCHCVGNVCPQLGLDDYPCYHCYLYDDTRKSRSPSDKEVFQEFLHIQVSHRQAT